MTSLECLVEINMASIAITQGDHNELNYCWASVADAGPTFIQLMVKPLFARKAGRMRGLTLPGMYCPSGLQVSTL